jgi:uncharacterized membrane protein
MHIVRRYTESHMLALLAGVLLVLWIVEFFAFHVTNGFIHIALVVGIVLLALHLFAKDEIESW